MAPPSPRLARSPAFARLSGTLLLVALAVSIQGCCCCVGGGGGSSSSSGISSGDALVGAAARGDVEAVHALLDAGTPANSARWYSGGSKMGSSTYAVEAAVDSGKWEVVEPLLVDEREKERGLLRAFQRSDLDLARRLVQRGAKPKAFWAEDSYDRALSLVDRARSEAWVRFLVELGMDPNVLVDYLGSGKDRPLLNVIIAQASLTRGSSGRSAPAPEGKAPIGQDGQYVASWAPEVFILIAQPKLDAQATNGETALMVAASHGMDDVVRLLLERGANPALTDRQGRSAAAHAAQGGHEDLAKLLQGAAPR